MCAEVGARGVATTMGTAAAMGSLGCWERYVKLPAGNATAVGRVEVGMRVVSTSRNCYCCGKCAGVGERGRSCQWELLLLWEECGGGGERRS